MKTIGILRKVLVSVEYFLIFYKVIENSENNVDLTKNVYQII